MEKDGLKTRYPLEIKQNNVPAANYCASSL